MELIAISRFVFIVSVLLIGSAEARPDGSAVRSEDDDQTRLAELIDVHCELGTVAYTTLPYVVLLHVTCTARSPDLPRVESVEEYLSLPAAERNRIERELNLSRRSFPAFSTLTRHELPISVAVENAEGDRIVSHARPSVLAFDEHHPGIFQFTSQRSRVTVAAGTTKTWLCDMSVWLDDLPPGEYSLAVRFHSFTDQYWESPRQQFEIRELTDVEQKLIRAAVPGKADAKDRTSDDENAGNEVPELDWLNPAVDVHLVHSALPKEVWENVAFHAFIAHSLSVDKAAELSQGLIEALPERIRPVAAIVRYELLLDEKNEPAADELRKTFEEEHPEFVWMMDRAKAGDGLLAQARKLRATEEAKKLPLPK